MNNIIYIYLQHFNRQTIIIQEYISTQKQQQQQWWRQRRRRQQAKCEIVRDNDCYALTHNNRFRVTCLDKCSCLNGSHDFRRFCVMGSYYHYCMNFQFSIMIILIIGSIELKIFIFFLLDCSNSNHSCALSYALGTFSSLTLINFMFLWETWCNQI